MKSALQRAAISEVLQPIETDLLRETGGVTIEWYGRAATALYRAYTIARSRASVPVLTTRKSFYLRSPAQPRQYSRSRRSLTKIR